MLPKAKNNRISIKGHTYRYIVNEVKTPSADNVPLQITIQDEVANGACLYIFGLRTQRVPEEESKFYMGRTVDPSILPRHVARLITLGLNKGWVPDKSGPPFHLEVENADVFEVEISETNQSTCLDPENG